jgi:hypothetical protein
MPIRSGGSARFQRTRVTVARISQSPDATCTARKRAVAAAHDLTGCLLAHEPGSSRLAHWRCPQAATLLRIWHCRYRPQYTLTCSLLSAHHDFREHFVVRSTSECSYGAHPQCTIDRFCAPMDNHILNAIPVYVSAHYFKHECATVVAFDPKYVRCYIGDLCLTRRNQVPYGFLFETCPFLPYVRITSHILGAKEQSSGQQ